MKHRGYKSNVGAVNRITAPQRINFLESVHLSSRVSIHPHHVRQHDIWSSADIEAVVTSGQGARLARAVARVGRIKKIPGPL